MSFELSFDRQLEIARSIFPDIEHLGDGRCCATCPGAHLHSTSTGKRDFFLFLHEGEMPHEHCFHASCTAERDSAMQALYRALRAACPKHKSDRTAHEKELLKYRRAPEGRKMPYDLYNPTLSHEVARGCAEPRITEDWLREHSPVPIPADPAEWPRLLLDSLYRPGEKVLVFTSFTSQGELLHTCGTPGQTHRLAKFPPRPGFSEPAPVLSGFPRGAQNGCWFLCSPVTGEWTPNANNRDAHGAKLGRRHAACVTRFPYLVLESDEAPPADWLRILVQLADPIVAIYTSGGKSYHALVRVDAATKEEFDLRRHEYCLRLAALGADKAAITAVRLTRLPGCLRFGTGEGRDHKPYLDREGKPAPRMQQLLYLNPQAEARPILK